MGATRWKTALDLKQAKPERSLPIRPTILASGRRSVRSSRSGRFDRLWRTLHIVLPFCITAQGAVVDRSIRTPISRTNCSTPERGDQTEEDPLMRVPGQQTVDQPAPAADQL